MKKETLNTILTYLIAAVWFINGLFCKVLNLLPRHEQIVASILGDEFSRPMTLLIGLTEILMAVWILTKYKARLNAILQMVAVVSMNILELIFVPELLLWGKLNFLFAVLFAGLVYYNAFILNDPLKLQNRT